MKFSRKRIYSSCFSKGKKWKHVWHEMCVDECHLQKFERHQHSQCVWSCFLCEELVTASAYISQQRAHRIAVVKTLRAKFEILFESKADDINIHSARISPRCVWLCSLIRKERQGVFIKLSLIIGAVDLWMSECVCVWNKTAKEHTNACVLVICTFEVSWKTKTTRH